MRTVLGRWLLSGPGGVGRGQGPGQSRPRSASAPLGYSGGCGGKQRGRSESPQEPSEPEALGLACPGSWAAPLTWRLLASQTAGVACTLVTADCDRSPWRGKPTAGTRARSSPRSASWSLGAASPAPAVLGGPGDGAGPPGAGAGGTEGRWLCLPCHRFCPRCVQERRKKK